MDEKIHSIEKLLFVLLKRHTAFNGQFSIGVHRRFCGREFAPSGDKPPPADAPYAIGLLNALNGTRTICQTLSGIFHRQDKMPAYFVD